jgi:hypothetical protein
VRSRPSRCTSRRKGTFTSGAGIPARLVDLRLLKLRDMTGEFEKPRFFQIQAEALRALAATSRSAAPLPRRLFGAGDPQRCTRKGRAKGDAGGGIVVEPHLCVGCEPEHGLSERRAGVRLPGHGRSGPAPAQAC